MIPTIKDPGVEMVLGLIDRNQLGNEDIPALRARVAQWIDQASGDATPIVDLDALSRRSNARLIEVLDTIGHPGNLRERIQEYRQKVEASKAFAVSELAHEDVENAKGHHLPGLLLVKDRIADSRTMLNVRMGIMALSVEINRKPRLAVMPYEQDYRVHNHVLSVLKDIAAKRLNRDALQRTLAEIRQGSQDDIVESVKRALGNRDEERYAACPY